MGPLIVADADGRILGINEKAKLLLGDCVGRLCWDAVGALGPDRAIVCRPGCTRELTDDGLGITDQTVNVRGEPMRLLCTPVGTLCVVRLATLREGEAFSVSLSPREAAVLELTSQGQTAPEAAKSLGIGVPTVRTHIVKARKKLGARSLTEAVALAIRAELIS